MRTNEITRQVRQFIDENFLFGEDGAALADDTSLLDAGLVDSTGILELVAFIESDFGIQIADAEIVPENLDSISAIATYVAGKQSLSAAAA
jgi:acyl carrier protein